MSTISKDTLSFADKDKDMNKTPNLPELKYPVLKKLARTYTFNEIEAPNTYEYLEDPNSEETRRFIQDQNALFDSFMYNSPSQSLIQRKLKENWNYINTGVPLKRGNRIFYWEHSGIQNHAVLYVKEYMAGPSRKLLDLNARNKDGRLSVSNISVTNDGKLVAYALSKNGSDWAEIKIREVDCGHDKDDLIQYSKLSSIAWTSDSKGFFYQRFPHSSDKDANGIETGMNMNATLYYHTVGSLQEDDVLAVEFPEHPTWTIFAELSDEGDYLFVQASDVIGEKYLFYSPLKGKITGKLNLVPVFSSPGSHWYLANDDSVVYLMTSVGANNFHQVVRLDLAKPIREEGKLDVVVQDQGKKVYWAIVVCRNKLCICYVKDVLCQIEIRDLKTGHVIDHLPIESGTVHEKFGRRSDPEFYFKLESYINPGTIYKVEFNQKGETNMQIFKRSSHKLDLSTFQMTPLSYSSNDGTNIPVFLIHKKNMTKDGERPCLLTAYGGYGYMRLPTFSSAYLFFAHHFNGVVAVLNIRGGSEFGRSWWDEARLLNKQNGFDDFIAGAKFLLNNGYTKPQKLAITGVSNGGLLIGAVVNQRPELFGAAIPQMGIMDMMRYHKFTIGHLWVGEFGNPEDATYTSYLRKYSPLHNIRAPKTGQYPSMLVTACDHDDRVVPSHSYKYVAELQNMASLNPLQKNPLLCKIYRNCGHVAGKSNSQMINEWSDIFSFLQLTLDYEFQNA